MNGGAASMVGAVTPGGGNMGSTGQEDIQSLRGMITAGWKTRIIYEGVRTGLFDALRDEPRDTASLASELGLHEGALFRVLRALSSLSVCRHVGPRSFAITSMGALLKSDAESSLRSLSIHWGGRVMASLETIGHTLETGEPGRGKGDFGSLNASAFDGQAFNRAMADQSRPVARVLAQLHDFSRYDCVMDVGGGYGGLLTEVLLAHPNVQGAIYDLPAVEAGAVNYLSEAGLRDRVRYMPGSFFENVAPGADCLLLKFILHDWDDRESAAILANCRTAVEEGASLLIVERIMPERVGPDSEDVVRQDLVMMPIDGKERTLAELETLGADAGFALVGTAPLAEGCSLIEMRAT